MISGVGGEFRDLNGGNTTDGIAVQLWTCEGTGTQSWTAFPGTLQNSGKCLDATSQGTGDAAPRRSGPSPA